MHVSNGISVGNGSRSAQEQESGEVVLLTGSTGSLGCYLLDVLLRSSVRRIICFNRSSDASQRQKKYHAARELDTSLDNERLIFLHGDLSETFFGIGPAQYEMLQQSVTHVLHNAWPVNFNKSIVTFEPQIRGVRHLVDFAHASTHRAHIFFISSISVVSNWAEIKGGHSLVPETPAEDWRLPSMGYGQSKLVSERLLVEASRTSGVKTSICRVGQIAGPVERGKKGQWPKQEWLPSLIDASLRMKMVPKTLGMLDSIDWIPVDVLAEVIVQLLLQKTEDRSSVFHAVNPQATTWDQLLPTVLDYTPKGTNVVSFEEWVIALQHSQNESSTESRLDPAIKLLDFYQNLQVNDTKANTRRQQTQFETGYTCQCCEMLSTIGPVSAQWMDLWMKQWNFEHA